jgi:1-acyl-sn-glycerol-3-phosphate acyltransferase
MFFKYIRLAFSFLHAFWILWIRSPRLSREQKWSEIQNWSQSTLRIMGVTVKVQAGDAGSPMFASPQLLVANHVSWLDVLVIQSIHPSVFVAKKEVRAWPVVGAIVQACEVVFVKRGSPSSARKMVADVKAALAQGYRVAGFPEGTSTEGHEVGMFHANLFEAAIEQGAQVQPLALRYIHATTGEHCLVAAFVGEIGFVESLHRVMRAPSITVIVHTGELLSSQGHSRRTLAQLAHRCVSAQLVALSEAPN